MFSASLEKTVEWWRGVSDNVKYIYLDQYFYLDLVYNNCKLLDVNVSVRQVSDVLKTGSVSNFTGDVRNLLSVLNAQSTYSYFKKMLKEKIPISVESAKFMHKIIMFGTIEDGLYKKGVRSGRMRDNLEYDCIKVILPIEGSVEDKLNEIVRETDNYVSKDILSDIDFVAKCHAKYNSVKPFYTGNKKLGIWFMNVQMFNLGLPPIVIRESEFEEYKKDLEYFENYSDYTRLSKLISKFILQTWSRFAQFSND